MLINTALLTHISQDKRSHLLSKSPTLIRSLASNMVHRSTTTPSAGTEAARREQSYFVGDEDVKPHVPPQSRCVYTAGNHAGT
jgi:hypothetical protein